MTTSEKLARIMELSVRINYEKKFSVSLEFAGHADLLSTRIRVVKDDESIDKPIAKSNIWLTNWNERYQDQLDDLQNVLLFIAQYHDLPQLHSYDESNIWTHKGLFKIGTLSSAGKLNESALQNISTSEYLNLREVSREAESHGAL